MKLSVILEKAQPQCVIMMGAPGSGKTYYARQNFSSMKIIDIDEINKEMFGNKGMEGGTFAKSTVIANKMTKDYIKQGKSFVKDGTAANLNTLAKFLEELKAANYHTTLVYIDVPLEVAKAQAQKREQEEGRMVPEKTIEDMWAKINANFSKAKKMGFDEVIRVKRNKLNESFFAWLDQLLLEQSL